MKSIALCIDCRSTIDRRGFGDLPVTPGFFIPTILLRQPCTSLKVTFPKDDSRSQLSLIGLEGESIGAGFFLMRTSMRTCG
jgi:hypothetical protein